MRLLLALICAIPVFAAAQSPVTLTPALVEAGSPELIHVHSPCLKIEGQWLGHPIVFFRSHGELAHGDLARSDPDWYALAGVDVEATPGPSKLTLTCEQGTSAGAIPRDLSLPVTIHPAHYRTGALTVPPKFVEPGPEALQQIDAEKKLKEKLFAQAEASTAPPIWSGSFLAPVRAAPTDSFGTRRMFNGKLASIHKGTDFRAATGTPVHAGNAGVVLLAQPLYYEGNCVMIDHGLGLISISMHLSRIDVKPGQHIARGQQLGLSGATGRVTGPHLHWAIRWQGAMLDPAKLLRLNLDKLR